MEIKQLVFNKEAILKLYLDNEWYAYTKDEDKLFKGIKNSLDVLGIYDDDLLVGLIRTVGDSETFVYILDLLILKDYQGKGYGKQLVLKIINKYKDVRQILLTTDNIEDLKAFYKSLGFKEYGESNILGYYYDNRRM